MFDMADTRTGKSILEMSDVALELGGRRLVDQFSWVLTKGERVAHPSERLRERDG